MNYVWVDAEGVTVGATSAQRWAWDVSEGYSGADAKTLVMATLSNAPPGVAPAESVTFHVHPTDAERAAAIGAVGALLAAVRELHAAQPAWQELARSWFGRAI